MEDKKHPRHSVEPARSARVVGCRYQQTLDGSFSAVSKPIAATDGSFESVCRDLQNTESEPVLESVQF